MFRLGFGSEYLFDHHKHVEHCRNVYKVHMMSEQELIGGLQKHFILPIELQTH